MKVFTVVGSANYAGAEISQIPFYEANLKALVVGSSESGCRLGILRFLGEPKGDKILHGEIETLGGKPFIRQSNSSKTDSEALVILRTPVMKGGKNYHSGDRKSAICIRCEIEYQFMKDECSECHRKLKVYYSEFPGTVIASGTVRDGKKPHYGDQMIVIIPKGIVFRTALDGYTFGREGSHYHYFDGKQIYTHTWEERKRFRFF